MRKLIVLFMGCYGLNSPKFGLVVASCVCFTDEEGTNQSYWLPCSPSASRLIMAVVPNSPVKAVKSDDKSYPAL